MKKVHFDKQDSLFNQLLLFPMLFFIGLFAYTTLNNDDSTLKMISAVLGFGLLIFQLGKQFFFKNYLGWNKRGVTIKLNSFWSKNINFTDVSSYQIQNTRLQIIRNNGSEFNFNLENIRVDDIDKIRNILNANTIANNV